MDIKTIESIENDNQSEDTLRLTSSWREIIRPEITDSPKDSGENTHAPEH